MSTWNIPRHVLRIGLQAMPCSRAQLPWIEAVHRPGIPTPLSTVILDNVCRNLESPPCPYWVYDRVWDLLNASKLSSHTVRHVWLGLIHERNHSVEQALC